jgi:hypothetical protein
MIHPDRLTADMSAIDDSLPILHVNRSQRPHREETTLNSNGCLESKILSNDQTLQHSLGKNNVKSCPELVLITGKSFTGNYR